MSLVNNILLRPHTFDTRALPAESDLLSILLDTAARLAKDFRGDKAIINRLWELAQEGVMAMFENVKSRLEHSLAELKALVQPILDFIVELGEAAGAADFGTGFANIVGLLVDKIVEASNSFSLDALEALGLRLADIANETLGITDGSLLALVGTTIDQITEGLMADFLGGDHSTPALDSFMVGNNIRKLKEYAIENFEQISISFDLREPIQGLILELRKKGIDEKLSKIREYVQAIGGGASFIGSLSGTLSVSFNAPSGGPPPPEDPVGWYATWFNTIWGGTTIGVPNRFDVNTWRRPKSNISNPDENNPAHWEYFKDFVAFEDPRLPADVMEKVAHITYLVGDFVEAAMHTISLINKPRIPSVANIVSQLWKGTLTTVLGSNNDQSWVNAYKVLGNNWFDYATQIVLSLGLGWIPEANLSVGGNGLFYFLSIVRSWGEISFIRNYTWLAREAILGALTLRNTNRSLTSTRQNATKTLGLSHLIGDLGCWLGAWLPQRGGFGINNGKFVLWMLGGAFFGFAIPLLGISIFNVVYDVPFMQTAAPFMAQAGILSFTKWFLYWNIMWDGNTDDGKYLGMNGYPSRASSPYLLPYESGFEKCCVQGNNGVFSHNDLTLNQTYSYDFTHDHREEILAIRAGTVSNWGDLIGDNNSVNWNFVFINHAGPVLPVHDVGANGMVGATVAEYGHGAHSGVRQAFALYGIPEDQIRRTGAAGALATQIPVQQGQVVMLAGNTGNSGHNHLHLDVRLQSGGGTIPFTFRNDVDGNGVPTSNGFYTSTSPKVPYVDAGSNYPLYHPGRGSGNVVSMSANTVVVDGSGSSHDDWYDGCAIFIFTGNTNQTLGGAPVVLIACAMVAGYNAGSRTFTVSSPWQRIPSSMTNPIQVQYRVGARPRASSDAFEKRFGYWAIYGGAFPGTYSAASVAATFADGSPNDKYARNNAYQFARATGGIAAATNNTVTLNTGTTVAAASMVGSSIAIQNPGGNIVSCGLIQSYSVPTQTVTIQGNWQILPTTADTFLIGGPVFAQALGNQTDLTYHGNDVITTGAAAAATTNTVTLAPTANLVPAEAVGSFIVIQRGSNLLNYAQILSYDNGTKVLTIIGNWQRTVIVGDTYFVRGNKFSTNTATPVPARYLSYPLFWP